MVLQFLLLQLLLLLLPTINTTTDSGYCYYCFYYCYCYCCRTSVPLPLLIPKPLVLPVPSLRVRSRAEWNKMIMCHQCQITERSRRKCMSLDFEFLYNSDCFLLTHGTPPVLCVQILQLLQWLDRFWDVCSTLPADSQGISVLSLHWQWVQKHLILRLPQLLLGDGDAAFE